MINNLRRIRFSNWAGFSLKQGVCLLAATSIGLAAALGCGYRMLREDLSIPPHITKITVPIFENRTSELTIEKLLTEAVIARIQQQGLFQVVNETEAEAILKGQVTGYDPYYMALAYDREQRVQEYRLRLTVKVDLEDTKTGKSLTAKQLISAKAEYRASSDVSKTKDAEKAAQQRAADEFARDLLISWEAW